MNRKLISLITAFAIIFISSVVALADSPDDVRASSVSTPVGYYDVDHFNLSLRTGLTSAGLTREITYTIDDLYDLTYDINYGAYTGSSYAPVRMAGYMGNWNNNILNLQNWLTAMDQGSRVGIGTLLLNQTYDLTDVKNYNANMSTKLTSIDSNLSNLGWLDWEPLNSSYYGTRLELFGYNLTSATASTHFISGYTFAGMNNPELIRIEFPTFKDGGGDINPEDFTILSITFGYNGNFAGVNIPESYFFQQSNNSLFLYLFDTNFMSAAGSSYWFDIGYPVEYSFSPSSSASVASLPFNSYDFQIVKQAFYQEKATNSLAGIDKLVDVYASDDKIAAEQAQQGVESQVLDDFTGQGSESMSLSDVGGVKNVSSNAKQFLGTGSSGSNALSVFNVNGQGLWQWFSQTTADNLDSSTPTRGSNGYLTIYDQNMQDYLDGLGGDENAR